MQAIFREIHGGKIYISLHSGLVYRNDNGTFAAINGRKIEYDLRNYWESTFRIFNGHGGEEIGIQELQNLSRLSLRAFPSPEHVSLEHVVYALRNDERKGKPQQGRKIEMERKIEREKSERGQLQTSICILYRVYSRQTTYIHTHAYIYIAAHTILYIYIDGMKWWTSEQESWTTHTRPAQETCHVDSIYRSREIGNREPILSTNEPTVHSMPVRTRTISDHNQDFHITEPFFHSDNFFTTIFNIENVQLYVCKDDGFFFPLLKHVFELSKKSTISKKMIIHKIQRQEIVSRQFIVRCSSRFT